MTPPFSTAMTWVIAVRNMRSGIWQWETTVSERLKQKQSYSITTGVKVDLFAMSSTKLVNSDSTGPSSQGMLLVGCRFGPCAVVSSIWPILGCLISVLSPFVVWGRHALVPQSGVTPDYHLSPCSCINWLVIGGLAGGIPQALCQHYQALPWSDKIGPGKH